MKPGDCEEDDRHSLLLKPFHSFHSAKDTILKTPKRSNSLWENIYNPPNMKLFSILFWNFCSLWRCSHPPFSVSVRTLRSLEFLRLVWGRDPRCSGKQLTAPVPLVEKAVSPSLFSWIFVWNQWPSVCLGLSFEFLFCPLLCMFLHQHLFVLIIIL